MIDHRARRDETGLREWSDPSPNRHRPDILGQMRRFLLLSATLLVCLPACRAKLSSTLQVDGKAFTPTSCRSGQVNNFMGVDLIDDAGLTLRLVQSPALESSAILIDGDNVFELGECGKMTSQRQTSSVNEVFNIEGEARLECKHEEHSVSGTISFGNCH
jgi:hypothetical protein